MWNLSGILNIYLMNHHLKDHIVKKAISKMKSGKAAGPSGVVVEMIRAAGDTDATMIRDLAIAIILDGKVQPGWEQSFIVCLYKVKVDALHRRNHSGLKLMEQAMKVIERIADSLNRQVGLSQAEAQQMQSLLTASCRRNILQ